jgi:hypothetical protein
MVETDVPMGPPLSTTHEPSEELDEEELIFTPVAWCCHISNVPPGVTTVTYKPRTPSPVDCDSDDNDEPPKLFKRGGEM